MLLLGTLLAGAVLYAVISYALSFQKPKADRYTISDYSAAASAPAIDTENRINLNTATAEELMTLPGIGEKTAQAILETRAQLGAFRYPEDLLLVYGIGEKKFEAVRDFVYVK